MYPKRNLEEIFDQIYDHWSPKIVGELNDHIIKVSKIQGEFLWHNHQKEDEMFLVIKGEMQVELRSEVITLKEHEMYIVKRGLDHNLRAPKECWIMIIEKNG